MKPLYFAPILLLFVDCVNCERIVALFGVCTKSHLVAFMPIAEALAEKGHQVTLITPFRTVKETENIREIVIEGTGYDPDVNWFQREQETQKFPIKMLSDFINENYNAMTLGYSKLTANREFQELVAKKAVDLFIVDTNLNDFTLPIVDSLKVPFIYYSPSTGNLWTMNAIGVSPEYAYVQNGGSDVGTRMTLAERALNMLSSELFLLIRKRALLSPLDAFIRRDLPNARSISEIEREAQFTILNSHPVTGWNRPLPPNVIQIGALHARPPRPLQNDYQQFADGADHGFIIFTLGSTIPVSTMPVHIVEMFVNVFARLPQRVFWKWEKDFSTMKSLSANVRIVDWLPQQDLLGHKNARLFITHGGLIGIQEAVYHGIPLLGLPFGNDQRGNIAKGKEEGYALKLGWSELNESLLYETVHALLTQPSYRESAMRSSRLVRDEFKPGKEVAVYWIEHIMRHGAQHLQTGARRLSFFQLYLLDVFFLLTALFSITILIAFKVIKLITCTTVRRKEKIT